VAAAAREVLVQSRSHVERTLKGLANQMLAAESATAYAQDLDAASNKLHHRAFDERVEYVETTSNALRSHLRGLEIVMDADTLYTLPATLIARGIAEVAAACSWMLADVNADERAARGYASLFRGLENLIATSGAQVAERATRIREMLIVELADQHVRVQRREKRGKTQDDIAVVTVGRSHAKTNYQYSQRVFSEIPAVGALYSSLSAVAHGDSTHLSVSWDAPDIYVRRIGVVVHRSVEAWSRAIHSWVGAEHEPFVDQLHLAELINSMDPEHLAEFRAEEVVSDTNPSGAG